MRVMLIATDPAGWPDRPATVPAQAEYITVWQEWGVGQRVDGAMTGDWRFWRADGTFVEESSFVAGQVHGTKRRYHEDRSPASVAEYEHGVLRHLINYRPPRPHEVLRANGLPCDAAELRSLAGPPA